MTSVEGKLEGYKVTEIGKIPVEWDVISFGNVCEIKGRIGWRGYTKEDLREEGPLVIGATQINSENKLDFTKPTFISKEKYEESLEIMVELNDIILVKTGNTIGKLAIVKKNIGDATINPNTALLKRIKCNNTYLYYYMCSEKFQKEIAKSITIGAQPSINQQTLRNFLLPLPSELEQQKIAEILLTVDEHIENTDQLIGKTKELKKGLMQQLLTKGIGHTEFKQSELGEIPTSWEVIALEEDCKIIRGASPRPKGDPRYYGGNIPRLMIADITRDGKFVTPQIDFLTEEGAKKSRLMPKGTFVVACSGTYVGYPSILNIDSCIHDGIIAIIDFENSFDIEYLYYVFIRLYNDLNTSATHGGVFNNLTTQIIKEFKIVKPSLKEQQEIAEILSTVDEKIESYEREKEKYTKLKQGLMQQLLTGKIRVTV